MDFGLKVGMKGRVDIVVKDEDTAVAFGSGGVEVYATPMMVGLMENASLRLQMVFCPRAMQRWYPSGCPTPSCNTSGYEGICPSRAIGVDGKALTFKVEAFDEVEKIWRIHRRYIISLENSLKESIKKELGIKNRKIETDVARDGWRALIHLIK